MSFIEPIASFHEIQKITKMSFNIPLIEPILYMTTPVSWILNKLCIVYVIIVFFIIYCSPSYMRGLAFCSHVQNICMTTLFHQEGRFGVIKLVLPCHFFLIGYTKPEKWVVMYFCDRGINFFSFYGFEYLILKLVLGLLMSKMVT
jgi:hypothetical protein